MRSTEYIPSSMTINGDKNVRVDRVHIDGLKRTKDDYVENILSNLFKAKTFPELVIQANETRIKLMNIGCFNDVNVKIDTSKGPNSTPLCGFDVTFKVEEMRRLKAGRIGTEFDTNNNFNIMLSVQSPNLAGRGEALDVGGSHSSKNTHFCLSFFKPYIQRNASLASALFKQDTENTICCFKLKEVGFRIGPTFNYANLISHTIEYEGVCRLLSTLSRNVPFAVREASGYSVKSSIKNSIRLDTRDSHLLPREGHLLELKSEVAGLGGDVGFVKNEVKSQLNYPLGPYFSLQATAAAGILNEVSNHQTHSLMDRFYVGGPLTLRGFSLNSVGPQSEGTPLGGLAYGAAALHLYAPLPHLPQPGSFGDTFRLHLFANAGNAISQNTNIKDCFDQLGSSMRLSCGFGIACKFANVARVELNYCFPVWRQESDNLVDHVQFGVGINFL